MLTRILRPPRSRALLLLLLKSATFFSFALLLAVGSRKSNNSLMTDNMQRQTTLLFEDYQGDRPASARLFCDSHTLVFSSRLESRHPWPNDTQCDQHVIRHMVPHCRPPVALASYPGSGNTWLRYLIETATGVFTGSIYKDLELQMHGLLGEIRSWNDGTTIVQKTHDANPHHVKVDFGGRGILLLRNPYSAILSQHNFLYAGHVGKAPEENYRRKEWAQFVAVQTSRWLDMATNWTVHSNREKVLVLHYENVVTDLVGEMTKVLRFLRIPFDQEKVADCLGQRHRQGFFKRRQPRSKKSSVSSMTSTEMLPFPEETRLIMDRIVDDVDSILNKRGFEPMPLNKYRFYRKTDEDIFADLKNNDEAGEQVSGAQEENEVDKLQGTKLLVKQYLKWMDKEESTQAGTASETSNVLMKKLFGVLQSASGPDVNDISRHAERLLSKAVEVWPLVQRPFAKDPILKELENDGFRAKTIHDVQVPML